VSQVLTASPRSFAGAKPIIFRRVAASIRNVQSKQEKAASIVSQPSPVEAGVFMLASVFFELEVETPYPSATFFRESRGNREQAITKSTISDGGYRAETCYVSAWLVFRACLIGFAYRLRLKRQLCFNAHYEFLDFIVLAVLRE
jgi:hypothetical protein